MARGTLLFRECDLTRAIKAARKAGMIIERAWIERSGKIVLGFTNGGINGSVSNVERNTKEIVL